MTFLNQQTIEEFYDKVRFLWGAEPNRHVKHVPELIKSGRVLDVGVGEGRNALFLAEKGFDVTGIDISQTAIKKFLRLAEQRNLKVTGVAIDALEFEPDVGYDVVICTAVLHYFSAEQAKRLMRKMKQYTNEGGINLLTVFTKDDQGFKQYPEFHFFEDEEELREMYGDWQILKCERYTKEEEHGGSEPHVHDIAVLLARNKIQD